MRTGTKFIRFCDNAIDAVLTVIAIIVLLFAIFSIWSAYNVVLEDGTYDNLRVYKPQKVTGGDDVPMGLPELIDLYPDTIAWLEIFSTHIDYPIVQGEDNEEYISKNIAGEFARSGAIFLDYRNNRLMGDPYSLLYGHNVIGGLMFSDVTLFSDTDYFWSEEHEWGRLWLPDDMYDIELFACVATDGFNEVFFDPESTSKLGTMEFYDLIKQHSVQWRPSEDLTIPITDTDRIIGLSTCNDAYTDGRKILFGVLRDDELGLSPYDD